MTETKIASSIADRLSQVQERIHRAATRVGRNSEDITLVAVTKTHGPALIEAAYSSGLRHFGENRVEEAGNKIPLLSHDDMVWHMVGHIQSRKAGQVPALFEWVHSIDRLKVARRLSQAAIEQERMLDVLLEVNLSGEESKYGFDMSHWPGDEAQWGALIEAIEAILALPHLRLKGLMTMPPLDLNPETTRPIFARLAKLRDSLAGRFPEGTWDHLSMGMTNDFEVAIEEGATMVRIGTAIFGPRET